MLNRQCGEMRILMSCCQGAAKSIEDLPGSREMCREIVDAAKSDVNPSTSGRIPAAGKQGIGFGHAGNLVTRRTSLSRNPGFARLPYIAKF
jgi:hypothetical protein